MATATNSTIIHKIVDGYYDIMINKSDPRVNDWPLMSSPFPTLVICLSYAYFCKVIGPKFMEKRKPMELQKILIVYNIIQVIISALLFHESLAGGWFNHYSFRCQPVDYSTNPLAMRMAGACWWYYISKFTEFLDTIFFVLRKKNNQISTLHIIHHGVMPISVWFGVKFSAGGHGTFFGMVNTFVHIIMYSYYLLAALGGRFQKYLWWKKYLTWLQMAQFLAVMIHTSQLFFIECDYNRFLLLIIVLQAIMFYYLFTDFYRQTYKKRKTLKEDDKQGVQQMNTSICHPNLSSATSESHVRASVKKTD